MASMTHSSTIQMRNINFLADCKRTMKAGSAMHFESPDKSIAGSGIVLLIPLTDALQTRTPKACRTVQGSKELVASVRGSASATP